MSTAKQRPRASASARGLTRLRGLAGSARVHGRFSNDPPLERPPMSALLRWKLGRGERDAHHERPCWDVIPRVQGPPELLQPDNDDKPGLCWIGHATALLRLGGLTLITDPVFHGLPMVRREEPPACSPGDIGAVDVVLISHGHHDHLQRRSIRQLPDSALYLVPLGLGDTLRRWGKERVLELDWWNQLRLPGAHGEEGVTITFVPAQHWSRRGLADENRALWGGYVISSGARTIYFAGDSGAFEGFATIGERLAPEIALLPIGAYAPRWFMRVQHVDPSEALDAFAALGAKTFLPIHWGAYRLSDEPLGEPPAWLAALADERGLSSSLHIWSLGETFWL